MGYICDKKYFRMRPRGHIGGANPEAIDPELQMMRPAEKDENNMRNA
jgi:hypothetical protein